MERDSCLNQDSLHPKNGPYCLPDPQPKATIKTEMPQKKGLSGVYLPSSHGCPIRLELAIYLM